MNQIPRRLTAASSPTWPAWAAKLSATLGWLLGQRPERQSSHAQPGPEAADCHDALTGLLNRKAYLQRLADALAQARRDSTPVTALIINLDRFRSINDSLGHDAGDQALRAVADRLRGLAGNSAVLARLAGDEFALFMQGDAEPAQTWADQVQAAFGQPLAMGARQWHLSCSIGHASFPAHAENADRLLACADTAMHKAKADGRSAGRSSCGYHPDIACADKKRALLEDDLCCALQRHEFLLHYQPLVDLATGRINGCEALLRWKHPKRGLLLPAEFIGALEDSGLIHEVGAWVLGEACGQVRRWLDAGLQMDLVAVNVSALQFARQGDFVDEVWSALKAARLPARHLQLELTESTLMCQSAQSQAVLTDLRDLGVSLAIDDFGTGFSSLAYLRSFPVSVIKVDRSFVRDMHAAPRNISLVKAIVQMGHGLGLSVTAEGIETRAQQEALRELGCNTGQGYLSGRPVPANRLARLLPSARPVASAMAMA